MNNATIAEEYTRAWMRRDIDTAVGFLADDVVCETPAGQLEGRAAMREFLGNFMNIMTDASLDRVFGDETGAAVVYLTHTRPVPDSRGIDHLTITDGRISRAIVVFDRLPFDEARRNATN